MSMPKTETIARREAPASQIKAYYDEITDDSWFGKTALSPVGALQNMPNQESS